MSISTSPSATVVRHVYFTQVVLAIGTCPEQLHLPRYHAGHEIVRFVYGAIWLIPEYLLVWLIDKLRRGD